MLTRCLGVVRLLAYDVLGRCSRVALEFSVVVVMCLFTMAFVAVFMPVIRLCSMGDGRFPSVCHRFASGLLLRPPAARNSLTAVLGLGRLGGAFRQFRSSGVKWV